MLQNQEVVEGLAHLADSICEKCPMNESCEQVPMCGDIQLLKKAKKMLENA